MRTQTIDDLQDLAKVANKFRNEDILEPFDPEYLTDAPYEVPDISASEKRFLRKVSILENKLRKAGVKFEWIERWECFRVKRFINPDYPTYRYVRVNMDENDYSFGTEDEDLVYDGKVSVVVEAVKTWCNSKLVRK